jgi:histone H3/H4
MAKPWAPSHISEVAKGVGIDKRISGDVKKSLVILLNSELKRLTSSMEESTLSNQPERKTLGDPERTRLGFNRTRGLMIDVIQQLDSVGSSAVVSINESLEKYLLKILSYASDYADSDRMGTIKTRHLESALDSLRTNKENKSDSIGFKDAPYSKNLEEDEAPIGSSITGTLLTSGNIRKMARDLAGMKIEEEALEDLLLVYYDHAAELQEDFQNIVRTGSKVELEINMERTKTLMMMGWLRRMLKQAAEKANSDGSSKIMLNHVIRLDPWE